MQGWCSFWQDEGRRENICAYTALLLIERVKQMSCGENGASWLEGAALCASQAWVSKGILVPCSIEEILSLRIIIVFIYLLKITCNVGTQNWVSRGRMVMWATGGRVVMFSCCMAQVLRCWAASGSLSKPCHWCADLLEERKLSGRPHPQLPLFAVKCFWWEKINISAEAFSVSLR